MINLENLNPDGQCSVPKNTEKFSKIIKNQATRLSLLIANMNEDEILELIKNPDLTSSNLINEVSPIMKEHGFTDLNLDIESFKLASDSARFQYQEFVKSVKDKLTENKLGTLTVELTPKSPVEKHLIDVAEIGKIADFVVLMAYDYHYSLSETAGPVAPLIGTPEKREYDVTTALEQTVRLIPREKVILGIPLYGYEWETLSSVPGAPTISRSWSVVSNKRALEFTSGCASCSAVPDENMAPFVVYPGEFIDYEINPLGKLSDNGISGRDVSEQDSDAVYNHIHQLTYENEKSLSDKLELARSHKIAGVAFGLWDMRIRKCSVLSGNTDRIL